MIEYLLLGAGFAFPAVIQPGPFQAFLLSRVAAVGWKRTLPAVLAPLLSDIPIAMLVLLALGRLSHAAQQGLRAAGGLLLLYLAWSSYQQWRHLPEPAAADPRSTPRTFLQAVLVNLLNPNPWLGWAVVLGPAAAEAWRQHPGHAVALVAAFYGTVVTTSAALVYAFGTARFLDARAQRVLLGVSALILAALGLHQLAGGLFGPG